MRLGDDGWLEGARRSASPNRDARPAGEAVSLLLLHAISLPCGEYGGSAIEELFNNRLDCLAHPGFDPLRGLRVSAHFLIRRDGEIVQFVEVGARAWHAGASRWRGRERCNDFSIGVELEGTDDSAFADAQYAALARLIPALRVRLPLTDFAAHSDAAPSRKTDPGVHFDWTRLLISLSA